MKLSAKDMDSPNFWAMNRIARNQVGGAINHEFLGAMNDLEAKAVDDAVNALTKVLLMQAARSVNAA